MIKTILLATLLAFGSTAAIAQECVTPETELATFTKAADEQGYAVDAKKITAEQLSVVVNYYNSTPPATSFEADEVYVATAVKKTDGSAYDRVAVILFNKGCKVDGSMLSPVSTFKLLKYLTTGNATDLLDGEPI